jgi:4-amino-4-deoxy-L-arabinose transferase-like glycosyltransferase
MLKQEKSAGIYRLLAIGIILVGIIWRIVIYWQNRNLILDEANIARNLFERGFKGLTQPLSYEQYAPPVFLWIEKILAAIFGFGERVLRFYPLATGIAALLVMYGLLKKLVGNGWSVIYPLFLLAFTHIFIRYSSEVKQYMPDVFIVLSLLWLALSVDMKQTKPVRFALLWFVAGSVAIWACMPSVFALAGVGCYYGWQVFKDRDYKSLVRIGGIAVLWVAQFAVYYLLILKPQADSDYLQHFHQNNFLFATPNNTGELMHNWEVFSALLKQFEGDWILVLTFNTAFLILGAVALFRRDAAKGFLLLVPIGGLLVAAALNQFSLLPRVALFSMPLLIVVIAYGVDSCMAMDEKIWKLAIVAVLLFAMGSSLSSTLEKPWKYEQLTDGLDFLKEKKLPGDNLYAYHSSGPALKYYTTIHPDKAQWEQYKNVDILQWSTLYDSLAWQMRYVWKAKTFGFIFTNATGEQRMQRVSGVSNHLYLKERYEAATVDAYIFTK